MKTNDENISMILHNDQLKFEDYDYKKVEREKLKTQKAKNTEENSLAAS